MTIMTCIFFQGFFFLSLTAIVFVIMNHDSRFIIKVAHYTNLGNILHLKTIPWLFFAGPLVSINNWRIFEIYHFVHIVIRSILFHRVYKENTILWVFLSCFLCHFKSNSSNPAFFSHHFICTAIK